jgi:fluoroacetyl-CoA thioesterase
VTGGAGHPALVAGLRGTVRAVVSEADTAAALGSGDVPVLGTPRLLALAEAATVAALAGRLPPGDTTVGTSVAVRHRRPSPVGSVVDVEAELTEMDGARLTFTFTARSEESDQLIGTGTIERSVVRREPFLAALLPPAAPVPPAAPGA